MVSNSFSHIHYYYSQDFSGYLRRPLSFGDVGQIKGHIQATSTKLQYVSAASHYAASTPSAVED